MRRAAAAVLGAVLVAPVALGVASVRAGDEGPTDDTAQLRMVAPGGASAISSLAGLSDDGNHVFFNTTATISGPPLGATKVYDWFAGHYTLPVTPIGPSGISLVANSPDGRFLIVSSTEQLLPEDQDSLTDLYWYDGTTLKLIRINGQAPQPPKTAGGTEEMALIAADGSRVIFNSAYPLDPSDLDNENDLYGWIPATGAWSYLTPGATYPQYVSGWTADLSHVVMSVDAAESELWELAASGFHRLAYGGFKELSADGSRLYFISQHAYDAADLDADWDAYELGPGGFRTLAPPSAGVTDLVQVSDDGSRWLLWSYGDLIPADTDGVADVYAMQTGQAPALVTGGTVSPSLVSASDDASTLFYHSTAAVLPADTDSADDLYRWRASDGTTLVTPGAGSATVDAIDPTGTRAIIDTGISFVPDDANGADLYRFSGSSTYALLTPGNGTVTFVNASSDVKRVFFRTSAKLLPSDTNVYQDLYVSDIDNTPPTPTVSGPTTGTSTSASYTVGSVNSQAAWLECQLDGGTWTTCSGTNQLNGLSLGSHTILVHGWDAVGNKSVSPASVTWQVLSPTPSPAPTATAGPDLSPPSVTNVQLSPATAIPGATVTVTATATDASPVTTADKKLAAGSFSGMAAVDGAFDESSEDVTSTVTAPSSAGTYQVCVRATDSHAHTSDGTACATLTVMSFTLSAPGVTVKQGASVSATLSIARSTFPASIDLSVTGLPAGATATFSTDPTTGSSVTMTIQTSNCGTVTPRGTFPILVSATAAGLTRSVTISLVVTNGPPTMSGPTSTLYSNTTLGTSTARVKTAWSGCDPDAVSTYTLQRQVNGGTWTTVTLGSATSTSINQSLTKSTSYRFRVRATDKSGNTSAWRYGPTFFPRVTDSTATFSLTGTWSTGTPSGAYGGSVRYASGAGASLSYTFTGSSIAWIAYKGPTRGSAQVYVDGVLKATVSLYATSTSSKPQVYAFNWATSGSHTIKIVVVGTAGHPRVDLDAFVRLALT